MKELVEYNKKAVISYEYKEKTIVNDVKMFMLRHFLGNLPPKKCRD